MADWQEVFDDLSNSACFQWLWRTPNPHFKDTPLFNVQYLRNGTRGRHGYTGMLIGSYTRPTQRYKFEWPWVTLSDCNICNDTQHRAAFATAELLVKSPLANAGLYATVLSICLSVYSSIRLSPEMRAQKRIFLKTKQFRAMVLTTDRKSYMGSSMISQTEGVWDVCASANLWLNKTSSKGNMDLLKSLGIDRAL